MGPRLDPAVLRARKAMEARMKDYVGLAISDDGCSGHVDTVFRLPGVDGAQEKDYKFKVRYADSDELDDLPFAKMVSILVAPPPGGAAAAEGGPEGDDDEPSPPPEPSKKRAPAARDASAAAAPAKKRGRPPGSGAKRGRPPLAQVQPSPRVSQDDAAEGEGEMRPPSDKKPRFMAPTPPPGSPPESPPASPAAPRAAKPAKAAKRAAAAAAAIPRAVATANEVATAEGVFRTAGAIMSLRIVNLMCHANFHVRFGPRVNFVTGQNGSGKSAILTALSIVLGLKKSGDTNRGKAFKDFIRHGATKATVAVTLANVGPAAYKPALFGPTLTIERTITPSSAAAFSLTGASKHVEKGPRFKVKDALALAQRLQIDCTNPCVCMSQDQTRSFLHSGKDADKYDFFMQASQLEATETSLVNSLDQIKTIESLLQQSDAEEAPLANRAADADARLEAANEAHTLAEERHALGRRLLAAIVAAAREKLGVATERDAVVAPKRHAVLAAAAADAAAAAAAAKADSDAHVATLDDAAAGGAAAKRDKDEAERSHKAAEKAAKAAADAAAEFESETQGMLRRAAAFTQEAASQRGRHAASQRADARPPPPAVQAAATAAARAAHASAAAVTARAAVTPAEAAEAAARVEFEARRAAAEAARADHGRRQGDAMHARRGADAAAAAVAESRPSRPGGANGANGAHAPGRPACRFGAREIGALLAEMARSRARFGRLPVGPLGACLKLTDAQWAPVTELAMGEALDLFACDSMDDERELRACAARAGYPQHLLRCVVYSHDNPPYVLPPHGTPSHPSLLSLLRCDDDVARNVVIDRGRPESTLLFPDAAAARRALFDPSAPPPHAAGGFDPAGTQYVLANGAQAVSDLYTAPEWAQRHFRQPRISVAARRPGNAADAAAAAAAALAVATARAAEAAAAEADAAAALAAAVRASSTAEDALKRARQRLTDARGEAFNAEGAAAAAARSSASAAASAAAAADADAADAAEDAGTRVELEAGLLDQQAVEVRTAAAARAAQAATLAEAAAAAARAVAETEASRAAAAAAVGKLKAAMVTGASTAERLARAAADAASESDKCAAAVAEFETRWASHSATLPEFRGGLEAARASLVARILQDSPGAGTAETAAAAEKEEATEAAIAAAGATNAEAHAAALAVLREKLAARAARAEARHADPGGNGGPPDVPVLVGAAAAAREALERHRGTRRELEALATQLKSAWRKRKAGFGVARAATARDLSKQFNLFMELRGYGGEVLFAHPTGSDDNGALSLVVLMRDKGAKGGALAVKDTRSLSGGERSFTSLALMLAIGTGLDMPFRAMDEPDIFMDSVNRRIALKALMKYAKKKEETQFIFLTPQDLSPLDEFIKAENPIVKVLQIGAARPAK